jgi:single-stranded-DNA-specific exonuclease
LGLSPLLAALLAQRGFVDPDQARAFLNPRLEDLHDPYLMNDMERVVRRIGEARNARQKVLIYGDYDVDGITATVVLKRALEMLGVEVGFYLPQRLEEGYGLKEEVVRQARLDGYHLIISADSGVRAFEACRTAREVGIDLIVTDHHLPDQNLPPAWAMLNPRRPDCRYPYKDLAAVGVVFKLVQALFREAGRESVLEHFLKLVAIGTVADMVPVTGENRIMVRHGLERLATPRNLGLKTLLAGAGVGRDVSLWDVGFKLAPRINAVTRMGGGREVVDLFSVTDAAEAEEIVRAMNQMNAVRQREEQKILEEIEKRGDLGPDAAPGRFVVVVGENWHRGVIGIVASRLVDRLHRPVLVLSSDGELCQGSGRSIPGFHLLHALDSCRDLFVQYGGHAQAAGCTVEAANCSRLADRLDEYAARTLGPEQLTPTLDIDVLLPVQNLSLDLATDLDKLAPFGVGNPLPVLASEDVTVAGGPWLLKEKHLKFQIGLNGSRWDAIWWRRGDLATSLKVGSRFDVAYTLSKQTYQGRDSLLLTVRDVRRAG